MSKPITAVNLIKRQATNNPKCSEKAAAIYVVAIAHACTFELSAVALFNRVY